MGRRTRKRSRDRDKRIKKKWEIRMKHRKERQSNGEKRREARESRMLGWMTAVGPGSCREGVRRM